MKRREKGGRERESNVNDVSQHEVGSRTCATYSSSSGPGAGPSSWSSLTHRLPRSTAITRPSTQSTTSRFALSNRSGRGALRHTIGSRPSHVPPPSAPATTANSPRRAHRSDGPRECTSRADSVTRAQQSRPPASPSCQSPPYPGGAGTIRAAPADGS